MSGNGENRPSGRQAVKPGDAAPPGTPGTGENTCPDCEGSGKLGNRACPNCGGTGKVIEGIAGG